MTRLIDTMTDVGIYNTVCAVLGRGYRDYEDAVMLRQELEALFAPVPHWSDTLDPQDDQTWVLCFVSNASASCTWHTCWICKVNSDGSYSPSTDKMDFLYATPVDLNLRYKRGDQ